MIDFLIDLRADSPTFLEFRTIELQMFDGKTVFIPAGFGHAFLALENDTVINYSLSSTYSPREEFCIYPLDMMFRDVWGNVEIILSERDRSAPTLQEALELGIIGPNLSTNTTKQSR
jgi:dTDP-4-dehydrorhamnose 3,5-epimerase-like enzyme